MSEETHAPKSKVSYTFDETSREITRTDANGPQVLATINDKVLEYASMDTKKFHPAVVRFLNEEGIKFESIYIKGQKKDVVDEKDIPKPPKKTIEQGDKTPAYVEWMKQYKPEEYKARYGIIGKGTVTKIEYGVNQHNRPTKRSYKTEALLATRKTHLTELPDANHNTEDEE